MKGRARYWQYFQATGASRRVMCRLFSRCVMPTMLWSYSGNNACAIRDAVRLESGTSGAAPDDPALRQAFERLEKAIDDRCAEAEVAA